MLQFNEETHSEFGDFFIFRNDLGLVLKSLLALEERSLQLLIFHAADLTLATLSKHFADLASMVRPNVIRVEVCLLACAANKGLVELCHPVQLA